MRLLRLLLALTRFQLLKPVLLPLLIDQLGYRLVHLHLLAPFTGYLWRVLVRCVQAHLAAEVLYRRGEIEIVDRGLVDNKRVPRGIHARGYGPDDIRPVVDIYVVVDHDNVFHIHELLQYAPEAHHYAPRVSGVFLLYRDDRYPVGDSLHWQAEVHDLRELELQ